MTPVWGLISATVEASYSETKRSLVATQRRSRGSPFSATERNTWAVTGSAMATAWAVTSATASSAPLGEKATSWVEWYGPWAETVTVTVATAESSPSLAVSCNTETPLVLKVAVVLVRAGFAKATVPGPLTRVQTVAHWPGGLGSPSSATDPHSVKLVRSEAKAGGPALTTGAWLPFAPVMATAPVRVSRRPAASITVSATV